MTDASKNGEIIAIIDEADIASRQQLSGGWSIFRMTDGRVIEIGPDAMIAKLTGGHRRNGAGETQVVMAFLRAASVDEDAESLSPDRPVDEQPNGHYRLAALVKTSGRPAGNYRLAVELIPDEPDPPITVR